MTRITTAFVLTALCAAFTPAVRADTFVLNNGGRVEGDLLNPDESPRETYVVRTSLGQVKIPMRQVQHVRRPSDAILWYQQNVGKMPQTLAGNWQMAELCRERKLNDQRRVHLENVLAFDSDHDGARLGLGYTKLDKKWVQTELYMRSQGLVRHQGKWRSPQELAIIEMTTQRDQAEKQWRRTIRMWRSWIGKSKRHEEAIQSFAKLDDPLAGPALADLVEDEQNKQVKLLLIDKLTSLRSPSGVNLFLKIAMTDPDIDIVDASLDSLATYGGDQAATYLMGKGGLASADNAVVNRAATALARLRDPDAVPALIEALVTRHKFTIQPQGGPGSINPSFGGPGGGGGLSMGGKTKIIRRDLPNQKVHDALMALVGGAVDFKYDKAAWKRWLAARATPKAVNLRRQF